MGNLRGVEVQDAMTAERAEGILRLTNESRFGGAVTITPFKDDGTLGTVGWTFGFPEYERLFTIWLGNPHKTEGKHPRPGFWWAYWVQECFLRDLAVEFNGDLWDEGGDANWLPESAALESREAFLAHVMEGQYEGYITIVRQMEEHTVPAALRGSES